MCVRYERLCRLSESETTEDITVLSRVCMGFPTAYSVQAPCQTHTNPDLQSYPFLYQPAVAESVTKPTLLLLPLPKISTPALVRGHVLLNRLTTQQTSIWVPTGAPRAPCSTQQQQQQPFSCADSSTPCRLRTGYHGPLINMYVAPVLLNTLLLHCRGLEGELAAIAEATSSTACVCDGAAPAPAAQPCRMTR